ncbi:RNB-domain-containing protein [Lichtheimia hyalospora FSU 10163]|nr:RNB-domain-containing protein [Lichtheimia hyalospora FSU 10163]
MITDVDQPTSPPPYCHPDDRNPRKKRLMFNAYPSPESMQQEIQNGTLVRGIIRISKAHTSEAYVVPDTLDHDIFILGRRQRNRALEGDVVAVRLLDVDKIWERKKEEIRKKKEETAKEKATNGKDHEQDVSENEEEDQSNDEEEYDEDKNKPKYCGEVVGILDRAPHDAIAGILKVDRPNANAPTKSNEDDKTKEPPRLVWFKPTDKRVPLIAIPFSSAPPDLMEREEQYTSMIMTARIVKWPIDAVHPFGSIIGTLGTIGNIDTESKAILADCGVKDLQFTNAVVRSLPKTPWKIPNKEYKTRRDLRHERIFTIDPATAKDLDDAVHVKELDGGNFEVGVHIADVSFFVRERTALDGEARERGTSTYLVDRVIPMLPSLLCEELCSLNPGIERLAFSVIWKMDATGVILDTWFGRSIIKSCAKLSYDDAQNVIEGKQLPETATVHEHPRNGVQQDILNLYKLSQQMRKRRFESGALSMNSVRLSFKLNDQGEPEDVWVYELKESNRLIEEFMLRANMSVAEKICSQFPNEALLRRHAPPIERRLDEFIKHSENLGYKLDGSSAGNLQASFNAIESQEVKDVLITLAIKPMQRAKYFCTGAMDISKYNHYALNVPLYTHFTSPIRRYADVIVHRQLNAALKNAESSGYDDQEAQQIALECNRNRDSAKNAQDMSSQLYLAHYLHNLQKSKGAIIRSAVVVQVYSEAVDIIVPEYGIEKRIHMDSLPIHQHKFDTNDMTLLVHWKQGVPVPTHETDNNAQVVSEDEDDSDNDSCHGIPIAKASEVAHTPNQHLNKEQATQLFKVFTKFDVLIQANVAKSPPIINVYLVNPFAPMPSS